MPDQQQTQRGGDAAREFVAMDDSSTEDEVVQVDVGSSERQWVSRVPVENRFQVLSGQESDTELSLARSAIAGVTEDCD